MMPLHPPEKDRGDCFKEDVQLVLKCDQLGFDEAWIGQHITLPWEPIPSNDVFISYCIPLTNNIRLGTGVTILPLHHPVNVAMRLALMDHLSLGRLMVGFGPGGVPADFELLGVEENQAGLMNLEAIDMLLKLWEAEPPFKFEGEYWKIKIENPNPEIQMGPMLRPYQKPHPPLAMSLIKPESMGARTAGQRGFIPITANVLSLRSARRHWEIYCEGASEAGLPQPNRSTWRLSRSIVVGETEKDAWRFARGVYYRSYDYMRKILMAGKAHEGAKEPPTMTDEELTVDYILEKVCIIGTVDQVVERLQEAIEVTGGFGHLLMVAQDNDEDPRWEKSVELLASEVIPQLSKSNVV